MTIREIINSSKMVAECTMHTCSAVNIGFATKDGREDEVQLTVLHSLRTRSGIEELIELFESMCPELETDPDLVSYLVIVASHPTYEGLVKMGF